MPLLRSFAAFLVLAALPMALVPVSVAGEPAPRNQAPLAQAGASVLSTEDLMRAAALDEVFGQFGASIEGALEEQGIPMTAALRAAWAPAVRENFEADAMHRDLREALDGRFSADEHALLAAFYGSEFGVEVSGLERAVTQLPPAAQLAAREEGLSLASRADETRHAQIEEMLALASADMATQIVGQSVRSMLIGMAMNGQQGDIEVPWEEIDAQLAAIMPGIAADITTTQRAVMFFTYQDLTEAELEQYLGFLRTDAARKLHALVAYSAGVIVTERMERFGESLAAALSRVNT